MHTNPWSPTVAAALAAASEPSADADPPVTDRRRPASMDLAAATPPDRNRAVDLYRALAMVMVAIGHWLGMVAVLDADGELVAGNLLDFAPEYGWVTWIGQVMPLFFFVGGFASARSLRSAEAGGKRPADWIATRLHRMYAPTFVLAATWASFLVIGVVIGQGELAVAGAIAAAIPLWFLANYTIDTALAPFTFRWFRSHPARLVGGLGGAFAVAEVANLAGVPLVPQLNWVIGWLGFQVAGFAWAEGRLPTGRRLLAVAVACWAATVAAVAWGPWPAVMLHHGGLEVSPTHPPSLALLLFGFAYSSSAAVAAPLVDRWLARSPRAWRATVAANGVALSVYLWHMTAGVAVVAASLALDVLPTSAPASAAWWSAKAVFLGAGVLVLVPIVALVSSVERRALLGGARRWPACTGALLVVAAIASFVVKLWSTPSVLAVVGLAATAVVARIVGGTAALSGDDPSADVRTGRVSGDAAPTPASRRVR